MEKTLSAKQPAGGDLLPPFRLRSVDRREISPWDYKEKKSLMILFFDPRESKGLEALAEIRRRYPEVVDCGAEVLAVGSYLEGTQKVEALDSTLPDDLETCADALRLSFPLLVDEEGKAAEAYGVIEPTLFVADEFNELELQVPLSAGLDEALDACLNRLGLISIRCPECGV